MSNLIKSGFVAFSNDNTVVIDANENKIIKNIDSAIEEAAASSNASVEEAIAEAMLQDAELEGLDIDDESPGLSVDTSELAGLPPDGDSGLKQAADNLLQSANKEAEDIINRAHDEAEKLRGEAYDEAESIKNSAREEGYQSGYEDGKNEALGEYESKTNELDSKINEVSKELADKKEELIKETEKQMVDWLCKMIPHITGVSIDGFGDVLMYMINSAMRELEDSRNFIIKVSTADYNNVIEHKDEIYGALNPGINMEIFEDVKLQDLQCLIETDNGIIDIGLDTQLNNLTKALRMMVKE